MAKTYYTYRIHVANWDLVQVEKWDDKNKDQGQPSGALRYQENISEIAPLLQSAKNNHLNDSKLVRSLGEALFDVLFDDVLRQDFVNFYSQVLQQKKQLLRVELDINERQMPEIAALPWEFMCVPARANLGTIWIGTVPNLVFYRRRSQRIPAHLIQLEPDEKLRVAFVISAPLNLPPVAYELVQEKLEKLAGDQANRVELLPIVSSANSEAIDIILSKKPHIFHFIGHGRMQNEAKQEIGEIALVDSGLGEAMWVDADTFSELFTQHIPGIVLLQACEGGMLSSSQAFVGVASKLLQQNVPVVVAMQYEVTNSTASRFALRFYQQLAAGDPVDIAAQYGRRAIGLSSTQYRKRDFATPIIFMRVRDGYLFKRQPDSIFIQKNPEEAGIALSISVSNDFTEDSIKTYGLTCKEQERTLNYQIERSNNQFLIYPQMDYLTKLEIGGPITDLGMVLRSPPFYRWQFPNLDLRVVNNSGKTIYITDVFLEVENSIVDPYPVLVIPGEEYNALHFGLVNDDWGEVKNAIVKFNLLPIGYPINFEKKYQNEIQIGDFVDSFNVDISDALKSMNVDISFINNFNSHKEEYNLIHRKIGRFFNNIENFMKNEKDEDYQQLMKALGVFRHSYPQRPTFAAVAYGEISFSGITVEGSLKSSTLKFSAEVSLLIPGGYGGSASPTYQYTVKLDTEKTNYQVRVQGSGSSVSQYLKSGDVDRFNIRVGADKSSFHRFRIRLIYNENDTLLSPVIETKLFVPKSEATKIRNLSELRIEQGNKFADKGNMELAMIRFNQALNLNPDLNIQPVKEVEKASASFLLRESQEFLSQNDIPKTIACLSKAKQFKPELKVVACPWKAKGSFEIYHREHISERIEIAKVLYKDIIILSILDCIEWNPKNNPPNISDILVWLWVVNPEIGQSISALASPELANAVLLYNSRFSQ